jgi:hypothetical protein
VNIWLSVLIFEPVYFPSQVKTAAHKHVELKTAAHKHVELTMTNILTADWRVSE